LAFGYLYYLYKTGERYGGGQGYAKDPVCGMQVSEADAPARTEHAGRAYYFCCDRCQHTFERDPESYVPASTGARA
jgi:YHS domain-containing protein